MGFDVTKKEIAITLKAEQEGAVCTLVHRLREPTAKQWKEYQGDILKYKTGGRDINVKDQTLACREALWNEIAVSVEGYSEGDKPLGCDGENWKRLVPILHKSQAIRKLGEVWAPDEDEAKNSGPTSDE